MRFLVFSLLAFCVASPAYAAVSASIPAGDTTYVLAKVIEVQSQTQEQVPDTGIMETVQALRAEVESGANQGAIVTVENDYSPLSIGEEFYLEHVVDSVSGDSYSVSEPYRIPQLLMLGALFLVTIVLFGGFQGMRALISLAASLVLILFLLLPGILHGYPPVWAALGVASLIIIFGSYVTHGFNRVTTAAVLGMVVTIAVTGFLAEFTVAAMHFSGFATEETATLNFQTGGGINFVGLLLGGILIGLLGVLYDAAIGQAVAIDELTHAAPDATRWHVFRRAMRIGREHIGALVNTLAIAYVGVALPFLLLLYNLAPGMPLAVVLNQEILSAEIVRIMIGGIGLVLAVPITTAIALYILVGRNKAASL